MPTCPKCGKSLTDNQMFSPSFASDFSFVEAEFECQCGAEGIVFYDYKSTAMYLGED